ncbi:MAG: hypothetical protein JKX73_02095, partial [Flavobacteriales bacterium]|nr:hypothetical protein [Flavobacteriales bacterium]
RFRKRLLDIHDKNPDDKKEILDNIITTWTGEQNQIDDILVMGVQI